MIVTQVFVEAMEGSSWANSLLCKPGFSGSTHPRLCKYSFRRATKMAPRWLRRQLSEALRNWARRLVSTPSGGLSLQRFNAACSHRALNWSSFSQLLTAHSFLPRWRTARRSRRPVFEYCKNTRHGCHYPVKFSTYAWTLLMFRHAALKKYVAICSTKFGMNRRFWVPAFSRDISSQAFDWTFQPGYILCYYTGNCANNFHGNKSPHHNKPVEIRSLSQCYQICKTFFAVFHCKAWMMKKAGVVWNLHFILIGQPIRK